MTLTYDPVEFYTYLSDTPFNPVHLKSRTIEIKNTRQLDGYTAFGMLALPFIEFGLVETEEAFFVLVGASIGEIVVIGTGETAAPGDQFVWKGSIEEFKANWQLVD